MLNLVETNINVSTYQMLNPSADITIDFKLLVNIIKLLNMT